MIKKYFIYYQNIFLIWYSTKTFFVTSLIKFNENFDNFHTQFKIIKIASPSSLYASDKINIAYLTLQFELQT